MITNSKSVELDRTLCVEYISLSTEEKRRIMNNTDPYILFRMKPIESLPNISLSNPIRTIYFIGSPTSAAPSSFKPSASLSLSTPSIINKNSITINHDSFINTINTVRNLTKENVYKYYGNNGFGGRELSGSYTPTKNLGSYDSIGIFTQSLEPGSYPNGHISSANDILLNIEPDDNVNIYVEEIIFYKIVSGQYSNLSPI